MNIITHNQKYHLFIVINLALLASVGLKASETNELGLNKYRISSACESLSDIYVTCDGIPLAGTTDDLKKLYAYKLCNQPQILSYSSPDWVEEEDALGYACANGYYRGPSHSKYYGSGNNCDYDIWKGQDTWSRGYGSKKNWKPIYCKEWLLLDRYDECDYEKYHPEFTNLVLKYGEKMISQSDHNELNECGEGYIKRTWVYRNAYGQRTECHQKLIVKHRSDFEVKFPSDIKVNCADLSEPILELSPDETGFPEVHDAECELIAINHQDQVFKVVNSSLVKIIRKWTVIDWCKFDPDQAYLKPDVIVDDRISASDEHGSDRGCIYRYLKDNGDGYMTYSQMIKVIDTESPTFVEGCDSESIYEVYDHTCEKEINEGVVATDNCDNINYKWRLNGITGHGDSVSMSLPIGEYDLTWIAYDQFQNADTCIRRIIVRDGLPPSPICRGIVAVLMPTTPPMVEIWTDDLVEKVTDNCTDPDSIKITFDPMDPSANFLRMDCDLFQSGSNEVMVYFIDKAGNVERCTVEINLQGSAGKVNPCVSDADAAAIFGSITTETNQSVDFVEVELMLDDKMLSPFITGDDGTFSFSSVPMHNDYVIFPQKVDDHASGVSTADLILLQKHIFGIERIYSPYKLIAADINDSRSVTAMDMIELRKLILHDYSENPKNSGWRFVKRNYEFSYSQSPWGFPEKIDIVDLSEDMTADFIAVKIGDLDQSYVPKNFKEGEFESSNKDLIFEIDDTSFKPGDKIEIPIRSRNFSNIVGYQFTLSIGDLEVLEIVPGALNVTKNNFGFRTMKEGFVTSSWNETTTVTLNAGEVLFTIVAKSNFAGNLSETLNANSKYTTAEAYSSSSNELGISFEFNSIEVNKSSFRLYQNIPNPFYGQTEIGFELPEDMEVELRVYDVTGKTLKKYELDCVKGFNSIEIGKNEIPRSGVLYYTLKAKDYSVTKKMVLVE